VNVFELLSDPQAWAAFATLTALEIVLGVDNVIFISILAGKLPAEQRSRARRLGLAAALFSRLLLLMTLAWIAKLTTPLFTLFGHGFSGRDLVLFVGGLFLIYKATSEIHDHVVPDEEPEDAAAAVVQATVVAVIGQILVLDLVFSLDSIITAVGMTPHVPVMVVAVVVAVGVMLFAATPLANFINANPTVVMLALGFLIMIGMTLIAEGCGAHVSKGYVYAAMAFAAAIEGLNMMSRRAERRRVGR
jgi:predicted tellurium resistance membrane protein TerC